MSRKVDALVAERVLGRKTQQRPQMLHPKWAAERWYSDTLDLVEQFSTSLDAIWPVAVRWTDDLGTVELRCSVTDGNPYTSAHVEQLGEDEDVEGNRTAHDIGKEYSGYNDNPATALCLALLRAHGVSEDEIKEALK